MSPQRVRPNVPTVTSETFDDEVVIINFDSGCYHSVQGSGVDVWRMIGSGATVQGIIAEMARRYAADADRLDVAVKSFVSKLHDEGLVVFEQSDDAEDPAPPEATGPGERRPFEAPVLNTFSDMQELLWLDPIHEVDESGWPVAAREKG